MRSSILIIDLVIVFAFVAVGRDTHDESQALVDIVTTAAPFMLALIVGWLVMRAWVDPVATRTGVGVWAITVALGMVLRRFVYDDGIALPFVIVATAFFGALLIGWRLIAQRLVARQGAGTH